MRNQIGFFFCLVLKAPQVYLGWICTEPYAKMLHLSITQHSACVRFPKNGHGVLYGGFLNELAQQSKCKLASGLLVKADIQGSLSILIQFNYAHTLYGMNRRCVSYIIRVTYGIAIDNPLNGLPVINVDDEIDHICARSRVANIISFAVVNHSLLIVRLSQAQSNQDSQCQQFKTISHKLIIICDENRISRRKNIKKVYIHRT